MPLNPTCLVGRVPLLKETYRNEGTLIPASLLEDLGSIHGSRELENGANRAIPPAKWGRGQWGGWRGRGSPI